MHVVCAHLSDGGRQAVIVQSHAGPEDGLADGRDPPASRTGHFRDESPDMKPLEEAAHGVRLPSPPDWILNRGKDPAADVGVAEATEQVVAIEHGGEQADVVAAVRIESGTTCVFGSSATFVMAFLWCWIGISDRISPPTTLDCLFHLCA